MMVQYKIAYFMKIRLVAVKLLNAFRQKDGAILIGILLRACPRNDDLSNILSQLQKMSLVQVADEGLNSSSSRFEILYNVVCFEINYPSPELKRFESEVEITKLRKYLWFFCVTFWELCRRYTS
jgi:hypothetical protein